LISTISHKIKVSVQTKFEPHYIKNIDDHFLFSYFIQIENCGQNEVKLMSRYWEITDAAGTKRIVEGEGVVGEQPLIKPGNLYRYSSACDFSTPFGRMEGFYTFMNTLTFEYFKVKIPEMILATPHNLS
jgi:ApaG protein